jgi:hypothetical protein
MLQDQINAAFDNGERLLAASLPFETKPKVLSHDELERVRRWVSWAEERCVRAVPAKPASIAMFVVEEKAGGRPAEQILSLLRAIEALHFHHLLANPVATPVVRQALEEVIHIEPPRSWRAEDKVLFATLDPMVRDVIARRENERLKS